MQIIRNKIAVNVVMSSGENVRSGSLGDAEKWILRVRIGKIIAGGYR